MELLDVLGILCTIYVAVEVALAAQRTTSAPFGAVNADGRSISVTVDRRSRDRRSRG